MALIEIKDPTPRDLRIFGLLMLAFLGLVGGVVWWRGGSPSVAYGLWGAGAALTDGGSTPARLALAYGPRSCVAWQRQADGPVRRRRATGAPRPPR